LRELAELPNGYVKLSGLEQISGEPHPFGVTSPLAEAVVTAFGPGRVMWSSHCPHSPAAGSHRDVAGVPNACLPSLSEREREFIRWETAAQLWGK
jgi:L-fuconolactonase